MTTEEIVKIWDSESQAVNDCIIEILESYMEVLNLFEATMNRDVISRRIRLMALELCKQRKELWAPILETAKRTKDDKKC